MALNLPATVSLVVLLLSTSPLFLHVTFTIVVNLTVNLDVSVTKVPKIVSLHRTVLYAPDTAGTPMHELI